MAKAVQKIKLSPSRDIPFNKLVLAQSNVRRTKAGISIEDLAEDIARRSLLQSLNVRPISDAEGQETGMFEVPAGGRRYRALELLVKQKRLAKTAPVPCIVNESTEITPEEDSLAENVHRVALHPLDQFRAFQTLREQGRPEEDIAAIFFVSVNVVKQRLRLAAVSPTLLDVYADDGMSLEQLMAFSVTAVIVGHWSTEGGHYPAVAYQTAFGLGIVLQAIALIWFAVPWLRDLGKQLSAAFAHPDAGPASQPELVLVPAEGSVLEGSQGLDW